MVGQLFKAKIVKSGSIEHANQHAKMNYPTGCSVKSGSRPHYCVSRHGVFGGSRGLLFNLKKSKVVNCSQDGNIENTICTSD